MSTWKRILASFSIVVIITLLVLTMLACLFRSTKVQTATVSVLAEQLSRGLNTRVEVGELDYAFPNRLLIHNVLVEDQFADTLLYVDTLMARADLWKLVAEDTLVFNDITLAGALSHIYQIEQILHDTVADQYDTVYVPNYQFIVDAFAQEEDNDATSLPNMRIDRIRLARLDMQYYNWTADVASGILHLQNLSPERFEAEIESLVASIDGHQPGIQPLNICNLQAHAILTDSVASMPTFHLELPHTCINAKEMFIDHGVISLQMPGSTITPSDFGPLLPGLRHMRAPWSFTGSLNGTVDSLNASHLDMRFRGKPLFKGSLTVMHLPSLIEELSPYMVDGQPCHEKVSIIANCDDFTFSKATLQDILAGVNGHPTILPEPLEQLGQVHYKGTLAGRIDDLQLRGAFTSNVGSIRTDGWASISSELNGIDYKGLLSTHQFKLGKVLGINDLGSLSATIVSNGHLDNETYFNGTIEGDISELDYRGYHYTGLHLDGTIAEQSFKGKIISKDPNISFTLNSQVAFGNQPTYDVSLALNHLRMGELHLSDKYADSDLRLMMKAHGAGKDIDSISTQIEITNLCFARPAIEDTLLMKEFSVTVTPRSRSTQTFKVVSDYLNVKVSGQYTLSELPTSLKRIAAAALPSLFSREEEIRLRQAPLHNELDYYIYARNLDHVSEVLELPISIGDMPTIKGMLSDATGEMSLQVNMPDLETETMELSDIALSISSNKRHEVKSSLFAYLHHGSSPTQAKIGDLQLYVNASAAADSLNLLTSWTNPDSVRHAGDVNIVSTFSRYANKPLVSAKIMPTEILIGDSIWQFSPSTISYIAADTVLDVKHFQLGSVTQQIYANGVASTHAEDTIRIKLQDIDLGYFLSEETFVEKSITFSGRVTGWVKGYGILKSPMFEAEVSMLDAQINRSLVGDAYATATLDKDNRVVITGNVYDRRLASSAYKPTVHVDGLVGGPQGGWELNIKPDSVEVGFVNHWVRSFLNNMSGRASGDVRVWGNPKTGKTLVSANVKAHDVGVTIPYTGGRYFLNDSVIMDSLTLRIPTTHMRDMEGNPVGIQGLVTHNEQWQNIHFDVTADVHKAIVIDLPTNDDNLYSGHLYADGKAHVWGDDHACHIDVNARTTGGNFVLSVGGASSASANSFVEFIDKRELTPKEKWKKRKSAIKEKLNEANKLGQTYTFDMTLLAEVTPMVDVNVLLDSRTGDGIRGNGEGNIRLNILNDKVTMLGGLTLQRGLFGFTLQNVIHRDFQLEEGSSVTWTGVPEDPELNVRALYKVSASLRDLFGADAPTATSRASVPVHCVLNVTERLSHPLIRFGIELPSCDESLASEVKSVINTDEMLTRQVLYLLIFSRFYTPEYIEQTGTVGVNETYSLISSTITGQINSWLSRLTDAVSFGFNVRSDGQGADASQEYEAQFAFTPVRGLMINGNFGYRYNDISNQPVFGNLDVEYAITDNGKLRIKGYTHTVDKYSLREASTIQGLGLVFKHDFNWGDSKQLREESKLRAQRKKNGDKQDTVRLEACPTMQPSLKKPTHK